ncbi:hypothetical protein [Chitinophaga nivalis]|uniref:Uncharacterized protein n=1 Tax=Chitinophaga nivalis TaxID=2991709 RepID=A0ABT3IP20_9BACT|nr:hypothetical protein [Chitinophaga nivalis]MCW3464594.1 hypothetical protein [Chitinophaga nivalis]MCW3485715.1 hypothetical protein [Chitinophaga nivalis]
MKKVKFVWLSGIAIFVYSVLSVASAKTNDHVKNIGFASADTDFNTSMFTTSAIAAVSRDTVIEVSVIASAMYMPQVSVFVAGTITLIGLSGEQDPDRIRTGKREAVKNIRLSSLD